MTALVLLRKGGVVMGAIVATVALLAIVAAGMILIAERGATLLGG